MFRRSSTSSNSSTRGLKLNKTQRRARDDMKRRAESGDTHYMFLLGWYYLSGTEGLFQRDDEKAFYWIEQAHLDGDVRGTAVIGSMYLVGAGTAMNKPKAITLLGLAASECDLAAYHLGRILLKGEHGIPADRSQAQACRLLQSVANQTCTHQILGPKFRDEAQQIVRKLIWLKIRSRCSKTGASLDMRERSERPLARNAGKGSSDKTLPISNQTRHMRFHNSV